MNGHDDGYIPGDRALIGWVFMLVGLLLILRVM